MFKRFLLTVCLLTLVSTAWAQNYYSQVTIKLVNATTGQPLSCADLANYDAVGLNLYTPDYHLWYYADLLGQDDCSVVRFTDVYKGYYFITFAGRPSSGRPIDSIQSVYNDGSPSEYTASTVSFASSSATTTKTFRVRPDGADITLGTTSITTDAYGNAIVTTTGTGFGNTKGWVDIGGKLTNSTTYIQSWTDTEVKFKLPSSYKDPAYLAICPKYYGCIMVYQGQ